MNEEAFYQILKQPVLQMYTAISQQKEVTDIILHILFVVFINNGIFLPNKCLVQITLGKMPKNAPRVLLPFILYSIRLGRLLNE